jgi:formylglycine-generating enzyme required for sulfatase activity
MWSIIPAVVLLFGARYPARSNDQTWQKQTDAPSSLAAPFDAGKAKAAQEAWAKSLGKPSPVEKNSIGMELILIPPGKFTMGSQGAEIGHVDNEALVEVTLSREFYLGKFEVTQREWQAVMGTTPWKVKNKVLKEVREGDAYPATMVSWDDAKAFCKKLSDSETAEYRLPTDAEWEYACRAGTTTRFSFGDDGDENILSEYAWWGGLTGSDKGSARREWFAHQVGRKKPNPFGLYDMHGKVAEWCEDVYLYTTPGGIDPLVSVGNSIRVDRGGSWFDSSVSCRSAKRNGDLPSMGSVFTGFRIARIAGQKTAK